MDVKKALGIGAVFAFFVMGFIAMKQAMPSHKEERIYKAIEVYSPYKLEKRMGGLSIVDSRTGSKEKPESADVLLRFDEVNKNWGHSHLKVINNDVVVLGDNNQSIVKIFIETEKERAFLKKFYGI
jgi:hypothetical protein